MDYLEESNALIMFIIVFLMLGFLTFQSIYVYLLTKKRAETMGIDKGLIKKAMRAAAITTIVPALAIVVGLITLAPILGLPISWARLAMIGSLAYELMAANIGATTMGAEGLGQAGFTDQAFANAVWVMTTGAITLPLLTVLFYKRIRKSVVSTTSRDNVWMGIFVAAIMISVFANYAIAPLVKIEGGISNGFIAVIASSLSMLTFTFIIDKWEVNWLKEYSLSFSMIIAMIVVAILGS